MKKHADTTWFTIAAVMLAMLAASAKATTTLVTPADSIQAKSDAAVAGDTLLFQTGTHKPAAQVRVKGGVTYQGQDGAVIYTRFADSAFRVTSNNVTIKNLTFDGAGIRIDGGGSVQVNTLKIDGCKFAVRKIAQTAQTGILFENGAGPLVDSKILNCTFDPIEGDCGIYGYNFRNLTIANNEFLNGQKGGDAIHIIAHDNASTGLLIEQNFFSGIHRMAVELQGGHIGPVVQDNWYENPFMLGQQNGNNDTFAYSTIPADGRDLKLLRNVAIMPTSALSPDGIGVRIVAELGGQNVLMEGNDFRGGNHVIAANGLKSTGVARNNKISDYREAPRNSNQSTMVFTNNAPNVVLPIDLIARGRPRPHQRFGESLPSGGGEPIPDPPTTPPSDRLAAIEARLTTIESAITQTREDAAAAAIGEAARANQRIDRMLEAGK